ncbi:MAG TPA: transposase, partial [Pirellulales bacterium]
LPDAVWSLVEPLLPQDGRAGAGRRPIADRRTLTGILYVLRTGIPWDQLPSELGCGSGMTCLRRLRQWQRCEAWPRIQQVLLEKLPQASSLEWARVNVQRNRVAADNPAAIRDDNGQPE